jgi:ATP-dependent helicase/nuclease subunit A
VAAEEAEERNRLLYVALTRARDRLYVAGFEGVRPPPADCWYNLMRDGLAEKLEEVAVADGRSVWRLASAQSVPPASGKGAVQVAADVRPLPEWAMRAAPPEPLIRQPLTPSRLAPLEHAAADDDAGAAGRRRRQPLEPPVLSPAELADDGRFLRGNLTHALLEHLPEVPQRGWAAAAVAFLDRHGARLKPQVRQGIARETLAILHDPALAALFGPDGRAEVPIAAEFAPPDGKGPALRLTGKIDRLVKTAHSVLILDYKTNRPPPADPEAVAEAYLFQLAAYRLGVARIFPGMQVEAAILWTDGPRLMRMPEALLDTYEPRLWQQAPSGLDAQGLAS